MTELSNKRPRLILADDHRLVLDGLDSLLSKHYEIVARVTDGRTLFCEAERLRPDVVVSDVSMPHEDGLSAARRILQAVSNVRIVLVTMSDDPALASEALGLGIHGYVLKSEASRELFMAVETVIADRTYISPVLSMENSSESLLMAQAPPPSLTERQIEVLRFLGRGGTMKEIASKLHISPRTVAFHKYRIMEQLGIHSNAELVRYALAIDMMRS